MAEVVAGFHARRFYRMLIVLLAVVVVEAAAGGVTGLLAKRGAMAYIPSFSASEIDAYLAARDPDLGWSQLGARPDPAFPDTQPPCVSAYGESFTAGSEVDDAATFPHDLAVRLGCPVANFGVGAYGSDQALMFARSGKVSDDAPLTLIGHMSENILRNVNQYRNLLVSSNEAAFKPRYLLENTALRRVPVPINGAADFARLARHPEQVLANEEFIDRPRRSFPYIWSLAKYMLLDRHVWATVRREPWWVPFYRQDHPSGALPLTIEILAAFVRDAQQRSRAGLIVLIPSAADVSYARRVGVWPDQPLADALRARGVPVVHLGPEFQRIKKDDVCELYIGCDRHFTEAGNLVVAEILRAAIAASPELSGRLASRSPDPRAHVPPPSSALTRRAPR